MKRVLICLTTLVLPFVLMAQSTAFLSMAQAELQKRGLEEAEVRARLLENGIDVDNIQPTEYAGYKDRVLAVLDKMEQEKNGVTEDAENQERNREEYRINSADRIQLRTPVDSNYVVSENTGSEKVSTYDPDGIYGHSLFEDNAMDVFITTDGASAPDTYVLGEGDEVHISIFGSSQTEIHQRIGADGSIQPAGASKIFLQGMTIAQARKAIRSKLASHYSFREDQIAVRVVTARTVSVSIYGEVKKQGGLSVSALNNAFNALTVAGGPTEAGSVREIQLSRGGKNSRLDLYSYMMRPDPTVPYDLQNGDVLYVPMAQKVVTVKGAVNRPMR